NDTKTPSYEINPTSVSRLSQETLRDGTILTDFATVNFSGVTSLTLQAAFDEATADRFTIRSPQALRTTINDVFGLRLADVDPDSVDIDGLAGALKLRTYGAPTLHGPLQLSYATLSALK